MSTKLYWYHISTSGFYLTCSLSYDSTVIVTVTHSVVVWWCRADHSLPSDAGSRTAPAVLCDCLMVAAFTHSSSNHECGDQLRKG